MKETVIPTTALDQVSNNNSTKLAPPNSASDKTETRDVYIKPLSPIKESPDNNKGNSKVSVQCAPMPPNVKVVEEAEIKEPRKSSRISNAPQCYIGVVSVSSIPWYYNLIGYIKQ